LGFAQIDIKAERARLIAQHPHRARVSDIPCSIPGIGEASAHRIIAGMPEIGTLDKKQAAALLVD